MSASVPSPFPLVGLQAVANARHEWVAVILQLPSTSPGAGHAAALAAVFAEPDGLAALAPLDCIIPLADPAILSDSLLELIPAQRTIFQLPAALCADPAVQKRCERLVDAGYRLMLDASDSGNGAGALAALTGARALSHDSRQPLPPAGQLLALPGPHLVYHIDGAAKLAAGLQAGYGWCAGGYALEAARCDDTADDGTTRKRLLALLGLLARDADARELETLLKQDPALAYQLLKLVNSAAFAPSSPINSFGQAINVLGRRQLQRWLQLLLYARQGADGLANPLLPLAAVRGAQMETLIKLQGGDRNAQDMAFMVGVFSLLDVLLAMPMPDIISVLSLDLEAVMALLDRGGPLGALLALTEQHQIDETALAAAGIHAETYWRSLLPAYSWAIQVSRNV